MPEKVQFMILVEANLRDRMDRLRIVLGTSRANVGRAILDSYIHLFERRQNEQVARFDEVARAHGYPHWQSLVWALIKHSEGGNSTGRAQKLPSLEVLEDPTSAIWRELPERPADPDQYITSAAADEDAPTATFSG